MRRLQVGDTVYGFGAAAFAEYVSAGDAVTYKPASLSFEEAAAAPTAALTALQALHGKGEVREGQHVLINGASGGVGTFAVQLAKAAGAEVTGVCSTSKVDLVRSLGADHVVDYRREDFTRTERRYDLLIDIAGNRSWSALRATLTNDATCVLVGGPKDSRWLGPLGHWATVRTAALRSSQRVAVLLRLPDSRLAVTVYRTPLRTAVAAAGSTGAPMNPAVVLLERYPCRAAIGLKGVMANAIRPYREATARSGHPE